MRHPLRLTLVAVVAFVALVPSAHAGIPGDDDLTGCVLKKGDAPLPKGNLRVIDPDVSQCKDKEILIMWQPTFVSDRGLKENFAAIDSRSFLSRIEQLPISTWSYRNDGSAITHVGPMAQDFNALFGTGRDRSISPVDANGVALAGIKGLSDVVRTQRMLIVALALLAIVSLAFAVTAMRRVRALTSTLAIA